MRISKLVRIAYWIGLDQLDGRRSRFSNHVVGSRDDMDDWRLLWWCIYRLDSYTNLAAGTPYMVDEDTVLTALVEDSVPLSHNARNSSIFLAGRLDCLWEIIPLMESWSDETMLFNMHILTVTAMRRVGQSLRHHLIRRVIDCGDDPLDLDQRLSCLRLALPAHYLNPTRNALRDETPALHHQRLIVVLHLYNAKLLISIADCRIRRGQEQWILSWQKVVETSQDIASISEQWNSAFTMQVDPAICFIIFTGLVFIHIQRKSQLTTPSAAARLERQETTLLLHLDQFAGKWTQPKMLISE